FGLLVAFYLLLHHAAGRELRGAIEETDRLDAGWRLSEMEARRSVIPDERNSALQALKVRPLLPHTFYCGELVKALEKLTSERQLNDLQIRLLDDELGRCRAALAEGRKLNDMPQGRMPIQYSPDYISTDLSEAQSLRASANLMSLDVLLLAQQG